MEIRKLEEELKSVGEEGVEVAKECAQMESRLKELQDIAAKMPATSSSSPSQTPPQEHAPPARKSEPFNLGPYLTPLLICMILFWLFTEPNRREMYTGHRPM